MSKIQSDRQEDIQCARQTDRVTERQKDSMGDSRAAKEPALVLQCWFWMCAIHSWIQDEPKICPSSDWGVMRTTYVDK